MREIVLDTETTGLVPGGRPPRGRDRRDRAVQPRADRTDLPDLRQSRARHARRCAPGPRPDRRVPGRAAAVRRGRRRVPRVPRSRPRRQSGAGAPRDPQRRLRHRAFSTASSRGSGEPPVDRERGVVNTLQIARQRFPGAPNSLDALCRRFNVDASARTRHGALLDAELLAEVYLGLIGGRQPDLGLVAMAASRRVTVVRQREVRPPRPHAAKRRGAGRARGVPRAAHRSDLARLSGCEPLTSGLGRGAPRSATTGAAREPGSEGIPHGEDQGEKADRRDRRRRDDPDHLADDQGQADLPVPRPRDPLLRPLDPEPGRDRRPDHGRGRRGDQGAQRRRQMRDDHARTRRG